jgi:hypothetical protein
MELLYNSEVMIWKAGFHHPIGWSVFPVFDCNVIPEVALLVSPSQHASLPLDGCTHFTRFAVEEGRVDDGIWISLSLTKPQRVVVSV